MTRILPDIQIDFDEEAHRYSLRGMAMPSVTQIMRPLSLMVYEDVPLGAMQAAADRGTRAHEQISMDVQFGVLETDDDTAPYIDAWQAFKAAYPIEYLASEYRVYHKVMRYAGTIDLIADAGDGAVDIIDIKTTAKFETTLLNVQLAAYAEALRSHGVTVRDIYGLQLLNTGAFRFERLDGDYKLFLHCMAIVNAMAAEK